MYFNYHRSSHIRHLVYPLETVLDDSIGCAVWFAARGEGVLGNGEDAGKAYKSCAKVGVIFVDLFISFIFIFKIFHQR